MIDRDITPRLKRLATQLPAIVLTGSPQSGKSTLCRATFPYLSYTTLESSGVRLFAAEDPRGFLAPYPEGAIHRNFQRWIACGVLRRVWTQLVWACAEIGGVSWQGSHKMDDAQQIKPQEPSDRNPRLRLMAEVTWFNGSDILLLILCCLER